MSPEERLEFHEQWLHSLESNQQQIMADVAAVTRNQVILSEGLAQVVGVLVQVTTSLAAVAEETRTLAEDLRKLKEIVERYIQFRGDGTSPAN